MLADFLSAHLGRLCVLENKKAMLIFAIYLHPGYLQGVTNVRGTASILRFNISIKLIVKIKLIVMIS